MIDFEKIEEKIICVAEKCVMTGIDDPAKLQTDAFVGALEVQYTWQARRYRTGS